MPLGEILHNVWVTLLLTALVCAFGLTFFAQHDWRFSRSRGDGFWRRTPLFRAYYMLRLALILYVGALVFGVLASFLRDCLAGEACSLPDARWFFDLSGKGSFPGISLLCLFLLTSWQLWRCRRTPLWDYFISYRSSTIAAARLIADRLTASGVKVWFAEYYVLLQNYEKFQRAIDAGIRDCRAGIILTCDDYFESEHCINELQQLLAWVGPGKILDIRVRELQDARDHAAARGFDISKIEECRCYRVESEGGIEEGIFRLIEQDGHAGIRQAPEVVQGWKDHYRGEYAAQPVYLDLSDWEIVSDVQIFQGPDMSLHSPLPHFRNRRFPSLWVNLSGGPELSREARLRLQDPENNERAMYRYLVDFAQRHLGHLLTRVHWLHLFFHRGLSQFAITYWNHFYWTRKYSLVIHNQAYDQHAEFLFTFGFRGPLVEYCLYTHIMDAFVVSLRWGEREKIPSEEGDGS